jgi:hypothetical protein
MAQILCTILGNCFAGFPVYLRLNMRSGLGVAVPELEYVRAIRHDASWVAQLRGSEMNRAFFGSALATLLFAGQALAQQARGPWCPRAVPKRPACGL